MLITIIVMIMTMILPSDQGSAASRDSSFGSSNRCGWPWQLAIGHCRLIRERGHDDGRLADVVDVETIVGIHVRVVGTDVVIPGVWNWIEPRDPGVDEAEVIGRADRLADVAARAETLQRLKPAVE